LSETTNFDPVSDGTTAHLKYVKLECRVDYALTGDVADNEEGKIRRQKIHGLAVRQLKSLLHEAEINCRDQLSSITSHLFTEIIIIKKKMYTHT